LIKGERTQAVQPAIFLSYRRGDAGSSAGRLYDALTGRYGEASVFMDVDNIEPGDDFVSVLRNTLDACQAMVVVIGPQWLTQRDDYGRRRLDSEGDFVRVEVEAGLHQNLPIFPALVDGATMPLPDDLPPPIRGLAYRQAVEISSTRFRYDTDRLIVALQRFVGPSRPGSITRRGQVADAYSAEIEAAAVTATANRMREIWDLPSRPIRAAPESVWDILIDAPRYPQTCPGVVSVKPLTPGPVHKGYSFEQVHKMFMISMTVTFEVIEFQPLRRFSMIVSVGGKESGLVRYELASDGHTTTVRSKCWNEGPALIANLDGLISIRGERRWIEQVERLAEAGQSRQY
jgi:hypothetical protein